MFKFYLININPTASIIKIITIIIQCNANAPKLASPGILIPVALELALCDKSLAILVTADVNAEFFDVQFATAAWVAACDILDISVEHLDNIVSHNFESDIPAHHIAQ